MTTNLELIEWLFINPQEFEKKFQELLDRVPNIHSPNKVEFFTHFFLGSVLTLAHTKLMKNIIINNIFWKVIREQTTLKLVFKVCDNGKNKLIFRTVTTAQGISSCSTNELKELKKRASVDVYKNACDISGKIFCIQTAESETKSFKLKVEELKIEGEEVHKVLDEIQISDTDSVSKEFEEINLKSRGNSFEDMLAKLSLSEADRVKDATEQIFKELAKIYQEHKDLLDKTESAYHGFVYGFLAMNFKYRYNLDCYVERIEGKGYTDLVLISRKKNKSWNAIPVVVEFKAGNENVDGAIKQIRDRGYMYTPLSMRTSAKQGVIVGVNFAIDDQVDVEPTKKAEPVVAKTTEIHQSKGLINELLNGINKLFKAKDGERDNIKNDLRKKIEEEITYLYFTASDVKTENYLSRLILGQMLATKIPNGSKHIFIHKDQDLYFHDKDGVRKGKSKQVSTFIIKKQSENFVFSIIEYTGQEEKYSLASEHATRGQKTAQEAEIFETKLVPGTDNEYTQLNVKVEANSELKVDVSYVSDFSGKSYEGTLTKIGDVTVDSFFAMKAGDRKGVTVEDQESQNETVKSLEGALSQTSLPLKDLIKSESHFQSVMQGLLMYYKGKEDEKTLVFTEANPSGQGRIDLVISLFRQNNNEHKITVVELKYAKGQTDSQNKFNEGKEQIEKYKTNLKTFSDEKKFTAIYMVFNVEAENDKQLIYYGTMLGDVEHTSQSEAERNVCSMDISESESEEAEKKRLRPEPDISENEQPKKQIKNEIDKLTGDLSSKVDFTKKVVVRLGDMCNQHGDYPQTYCIGGSSNVFINSRSVHRQGDKWSPHASTDPYKPPHASQFLLKGSSSVFVNGKAIARIGDLISCGAIAEQGSNSVFAE